MTCACAAVPRCRRPNLHCAFGAIRLSNLRLPCELPCAQGQNPPCPSHMLWYSDRRTNHPCMISFQISAPHLPACSCQPASTSYTAGATFLGHTTIASADSFSTFNSTFSNDFTGGKQSTLACLACQPLLAIAPSSVPDRRQDIAHPTLSQRTCHTAAPVRWPCNPRPVSGRLCPPY